MKFNDDILILKFYDRRMDRMITATEAVKHEVTRAYMKYGPYASPVEAIGAVTLEFDEFKAAVQARNTEHAVMEAMQLATTAIRFIMEYGPRPEKEDA